MSVCLEIVRTVKVCISATTPQSEISYCYDSQVKRSSRLQPGKSDQVVDDKMESQGTKYCVKQ